MAKLIIHVSRVCLCTRTLWILVTYCLSLYDFCCAWQVGALTCETEDLRKNVTSIEEENVELVGIIGVSGK